jgi:hypothetical protein
MQAPWGHRFSDPAISHGAKSWPAFDAQWLVACCGRLIDGAIHHISPTTQPEAFLAPGC